MQEGETIIRIDCLKQKIFNEKEKIMHGYKNIFNFYRYLIIIKVNIKRKFIQYFSNDIEGRTFTGILTTYIQKNNFKL